MRSALPRYPVDRYLVESSNKFEMVSVIDDDIWNPEPALRPEDEIMLRKLHDMLQSTADDLKLLSGELSKFHEPGVQVKSAPTPLDEEFNEKVHIEEVVNAKFHGYKIVEKPLHVPQVKPRNDTIDGAKVNPTTKILNTDVKPKPASVSKRPVNNKNLGVSRTRIIAIDNNNQDKIKSEKLNNGKIVNNAPAVAYNEFSFNYVEPKATGNPRKRLQVQDMPSINIRSELKEQKVLQLDILPESKEVKEVDTVKSNISVVTITHGVDPKPLPSKTLESVHMKQSDSNNQTVRKISRMSTCDSSGSTNHNNNDSDARVNQNTQKRLISSIRNSPKSSARERAIKSSIVRKETEKRQRYNLDEWNKKLNVVYGSSTSRKPKSRSTKSSPKKLNNGKKSTAFNTAEYIPYSHLTLGGVRVSDIEREISDLPKKPNLPLSPMLDKILTSRENSFHRDSPRKKTTKDSNNAVLTTSDENLLQEIIDIERSVSQTLSKTLKKKVNEPVIKSQNHSNESNHAADESESYADDFEDDNSEKTYKFRYSKTDEDEIEKSVKIKYTDKDVNSSDNADNLSNEEPQPGPSNVKNITYTKASSLSFKDSVDIFEFVHLVDTHDTATQSSGENKITPKETQTSPRNDRTNIQPIHNDLWPSIDPRREVEKMFELEKDFIKKLIIDEYGDLLEKNINKTSSSKENSQETSKNVTALQKNTQTSPAHVKSVMTSPRKTKTRPTSPFLLSVPVHQQTSPMVVVTNDEQEIVDVQVEADDISVNLSSPRFSLRLPQTSREVLSNLGEPTPAQCKTSIKRHQLNNKTFTKTSASSSSSVDADNSSSEISSLGEIKIRKTLKKRPAAASASEYSSSSTSKYSYEMQSAGMLPLRSEGEITKTLAQTVKKTVQRNTKSDGETSLGVK